MERKEVFYDRISISKQNFSRLGSAGVVPIAIAAAVIFGYYFISGAVFASLISNTTVADLLIHLRLNRLMFAILVLPVYAIFLQMSLRNDFDPHFVLKSKRRRSLWHVHCLKVLVYALLCTVGIVVFILVVGLLYSCAWINWDSPYSQYFFSQFTLNPDVNFVQVLAVSFASFALTFLGIGLLFLLFFWLFKNPVLADFAGDCRRRMGYTFYYQPYLPDFSLFLNRLAFSYESWKNGTVVFDLIIAAILCLVVYLVGSFTCEKKEFYR